MSATSQLPVPYFELDETYKIVTRSTQANQAFKKAESFLELLDIGSVEKVKRFFSSRESGKIEMNMDTIEAPYVLHNMFVNWDENRIHVICIKQDGNLTELIEKVQKQSRRLAQTDFELLEKKEELEESLSMIKQLSAPFISISSELAFVPFFGDLDEHLIKQNQEIISKNVYQANFDYLVFDFSGVGNVTSLGMRELLRLVQALQIMGIETRVIGLRPEHAQLVHGNDIQKRAEFKGSLAEMIRKHM